MANLHNARKAKTALVSIVGSVPAGGVSSPLEAGRESNIELAALNVSSWVRQAGKNETLVSDTIGAVSVASGFPEQIATLIVPEDSSLSEVEGNTPPLSSAPAEAPDEQLISQAIKALESGNHCAIMLGGRALQEPNLSLVAKLAAKYDVPLLSEVFPSRMQRGRGIPMVERIAYLAEMAEVQLRGLKHLVIIDTKAPVSFFAYPGKASYLVPDGCAVHQLVEPKHDITALLTQVCEQTGAIHCQPQLQPSVQVKLPKGALTGDKACDVIAALMPQNAIISDESQTSGAKLMAKTAGCPPHDLLTLTGGSIGQGFPVAVGAAVACPDRPVITMTGDGSAMYTIQSLATMVREELNVTAIVFNNQSYSILNVELERVGVEGNAGPKAKSQLDLRGPNLDFVAIGKGMGVPSVSVHTCEDFARELESAIKTPGPHFIEVNIPPTISGLKLKLLPAILAGLKHLPRPLAKALKNAIAP